MKTFKEICMMTQKEVKEYMHSYLKDNGYEPISEDGFVYAKGDVSVLLTAHMDTVHKETCRDIINENGKIYFGWPITKDITKDAGNIKFNVRFYQFSGVKDEDEFLLQVLYFL